MGTEKELQYYKEKVAKSMAHLESGEFMKAYHVLAGEIYRCPNCGDYLTIDHECETGPNL